MWEQIQAALIGALLLVIPPLTMLVVAKIRNIKADLDAAFAKIRIAESELGIKTTQDKNGVQHVSRDPTRVGQTGSVPPQPLDSEGGKGA